METDDGDRFDLTGKIVIRGRAPEFIGSYSVVYRGRWAENAVAIKIIKSVGTLSTMRRKVRRERMVWESLDHPNILPFYGHADDEEFQPFGAFISPWCLNGDVGRFLKQYGGEMETAARVVLWIGVLNGVAFLHSRNPVIVHGDLKPGNILIDDNRNPRICDFGLSRIIQEGGSGGMTTTTEHTGTERYLAPELATDNLPAPTTESDVYAVGCLGLEFIYLERPYAHRQNNHHGCIITDIREGIPPASRQDDVHSPMDVWWGTLRSWNLLEAFWSLDPEGRPAAAFVMGSLAAPNDSPDNAHTARDVPMRHYDTPAERKYLSMSDQERLAELGMGVDSLGFRFNDFASDRLSELLQFSGVPAAPTDYYPPPWPGGRAAPNEERTYRRLPQRRDNKVSTPGLPVMLPPSSNVRSSSFQFTSRGYPEGGPIPQRTVETGSQTPRDGEARRAPKLKEGAFYSGFAGGLSDPASIKQDGNAFPYRPPHISRFTG